MLTVKKIKTTAIALLIALGISIGLSSVASANSLELQRLDGSSV